jgi:hypothetical protein
MKKLLCKIATLVAGLALASSMAFATTNPNSFYAGFNQQTEQNGINGLIVSGGPAPGAAASTCSSGSVTVLGGASYGQATTATCTTLVLVLTGTISSLVVSDGLNDGKNATNSSTPPNGAICLSYDVTHPAANTVSGAWNVGTYAAATALNGVYTTYTCTFASLTITAADVLLYQILAY